MPATFTKSQKSRPAAGEVQTLTAVGINPSIALAIQAPEPFAEEVRNKIRNITSTASAPQDGREPDGFPVVGDAARQRRSERELR